MMKSEYRRNGRVIVRRGLALSLGLWLVLVVGALPQPALAAFNSTVASTISVFYAAAFDRTPVPNSALPNYGDLGGLASWTNAYLAGEGDRAQYKDDVYAIADHFVESPEFQARYPATLTDEQYVTALYNNLLDRAPDEEGLAFWVGQLEVEGGASRGRVLADFTNSDEAQDFNPTQKDAMQSFIDLLAANDGMVTPEQAAEWLVENETLDAAAIDAPDVPIVTLEAALDKAPVGPYQINANAPLDAGAVTVAEAQAVYPQVEAILEGAVNAAALADADVFVWAITDTAANILAAAEDPAVTGAGVVSLSEAATVAEVVALQDSAPPNYDGVYALADTLANLEAAVEDVVAGATEYALTNPNPPGDLGILSAEQIALVEGATNANDFTWQTQVAGPDSPTFSPEPEDHNGAPQPITITTTTPGATIRFATVDNESLTCNMEPVLESGGEVLVDRPLTLYAIACLNNGQPSVPATATYEITNRVTFNDTGIDKCAENDQYGINPCPIARFPGQDAEYGRDAWARGDFAGNPHSSGLAKIGGGDVGFDFTRICGDGRDEGQDGCLENFVFDSNNPSLHTGDGPNDWACTRDNVTGLMWEVKTDTVDIPRVGLRFKGWRYTWYENAAPNGGDPGVLDGGFCRLAGDSPSCDTQGYLAAINAISDIREGGLCGRGREWRLPTSNELSQLMHYGRVRPSMDVQHFPTVMIGTYWTSETYSGDVAQAWSVVNQIGFVDRTMKSNYFGHILAVSGSAQPPANENTHCLSGFTSTASGFSDNGNGNGTVTHDTTRLMWARCALGREWTGSTCVDVSGRFREYNWETALQAVASLNHGGYLGYPDWRIPSVKELNSIIDRCRVQPSINTTVFPDVSSAMTEFWSSSSLVGNSSSAWFIDFRTGAVDWTGKANTFQVLLVRDAE